MDRTANAVWKGNLKEGKGTLDTQSGALKGTPYSFKTRFEDESGKSGTNPEELIAAAHAGCYAMQLSHFLAENGTPATSSTPRPWSRWFPGPASPAAPSRWSARCRASMPRNSRNWPKRPRPNARSRRRSAQSRCRSTPNLGEQYRGTCRRLRRPSPACQRSSFEKPSNWLFVRCADHSLPPVYDGERSALINGFANHQGCKRTPMLRPAPSPRHIRGRSAGRAMRAAPISTKIV